MNQANALEIVKKVRDILETDAKELIADYEILGKEKRPVKDALRTLKRINGIITNIDKGNAELKLRNLVKFIHNLNLN